MMRQKLMDLKTNKDREYKVSSEVRMGKMFDRLYINVRKYDKATGTYQLIDEYTTKIPAYIKGPARSELLMRAFLAFEKQNDYGLQLMM